MPGRLIRNAVWLLAPVVFTAGAVDFSRVSGDSLRMNVAWLAADEREGRMTPSAGLEASADYIGRQFAQAGLAPGGSDGTYFQSAPFSQVTPRLSDFRMTLDRGGQRTIFGASAVAVRSLTALDYQDVPVVRLPVHAPFPSIAGKVVEGDDRYVSETALHSVEAGKPSLILLFVRGSRPKPEAPLLMETDLPPVIRIYGPNGNSIYGESDAPSRLTLHVAPPDRHDVTLRNVAGILRGSDPAMRDQFVILSAHYDHVGLRSAGKGKQTAVYHGANDNASSVASLIEIAKALGTDPHPRRSLLFLALFGEEEGLLGSGYYVRHPVIPLARTVADINLEQLGRTDSSDGPEIARFALSGPSYSNLAAIISPAAKIEGDTVYQEGNADDYFDRSDNYEFALAGVVAHTIVVAFEFADYHKVTDIAEKIDYGNLAKVDRGIAAGVAAVANAAEAPKWSDGARERSFR